jgi:hypothetical protein
MPVILGLSVPMITTVGPTRVTIQANKNIIVLKRLVNNVEQHRIVRTPANRSAKAIAVKVRLALTSFVKVESAVIQAH